MLRSSVSRRAVLVLYRKLFRTAESTFEGDERGISLAHDKIRSEFKKNKSELNTDAVNEQLVIAKDAEQYLRESVLQARVNEEGNRYILKIKDDHLRSSMEMPVLVPGECYQPFK